MACECIKDVTLCCQGYWRQGSFIVTQDPMLDTVEEFWRMIWEHSVSAVVMLTEPGPEPVSTTLRMLHMLLVHHSYIAKYS